ncbi:hypothetical protein GCM10028813_10950 [Ramlibacter alkalitolerans]
MGAQLLGRAESEGVLFSVAARIERERPWRRLAPQEGEPAAA